jgi:hypothetical protein
VHVRFTCVFVYYCEKASERAGLQLRHTNSVPDHWWRQPAHNHQLQQQNILTMPGAADGAAIDSRATVRAREGQTMLLAVSARTKEFPVRVRCEMPSPLDVLHHAQLHSIASDTSMAETSFRFLRLHHTCSGLGNFSSLLCLRPIFDSPSFRISFRGDGDLGWFRW